LLFGFRCGTIMASLVRIGRESAPLSGGRAVNEGRSCPRCKQTLPGDAPQGVCPACLIRAGRGASAMSQDGTVAPRPDTHAIPRAGAQRSTGTDPLATASFHGPQTTPSVDVASMAVGGSETSFPTIPGYEILGILGRGGMGVAYKARQLKANRIVALKMILAGGHAGELELARFRTEAEALARLQRPDIVQIFEVAETEGKPYFSLEFVEGGSLARQMNGTTWEAHRAAALVARLARAISAVHERGVIHRDLKPANVLMTPDGQPKITDFGLAKLLDAGPGHTATGAILGTPSYMAPEQAGGKKCPVSPATDVYALGAILYELLTGRPPFVGPGALDVLVQVAGKEPAPLRQLQPRIPHDLEAICLKCLRKPPEDRYPTARALARDLQCFLDARPVKVSRQTMRHKLGHWVKQGQAAKVLFAFAGLYLCQAAVADTRQGCYVGVPLVAAVLATCLWPRRLTLVVGVSAAVILFTLGIYTSGFLTAFRLLLALVLALVGLFISWYINRDHVFPILGALCGYALAFRTTAAILLSLLPTASPDFGIWNGSAYDETKVTIECMAMPNLLQGIGTINRPPDMRYLGAGLIIVSIAVLLSAGLGALICGLAGARPITRRSHLERASS
jgi:hypothetical protein